jgi:chromosome condensin MukBEF ATPase and DNA-binding subunit MukB
MNNTDYSIDEIKLMAKVKRYKRRWKEQRNYSEYLKCKLAKKSLQVQELKAENAALHARIAELETVVERLVDAIESGERIRVFPETETETLLEWYAKMDAIIAEWKERKND